MLGNLRPSRDYDSSDDESDADIMTVCSDDSIMTPLPKAKAKDKAVSCALTILLPDLIEQEHGNEAQLKECSDMATKLQEDMEKLTGALEAALIKTSNSEWCKTDSDKSLDKALYLLCSEDVLKAKKQVSTMSGNFYKVTDFIESAKKHHTQLKSVKPREHGISSEKIKEAVGFLKGVEWSTGLGLDKVVTAVDTGLFRGIASKKCGRQCADWGHTYDGERGCIYQVIQEPESNDNCGWGCT